MARTLYLGLLKSRLDRAAEIEFFAHLNCRFSFGVEYQSCSMMNYLSAVKIWAHFVEQSASYEFSCNKPRAVPINIILVPVLLFRAYPSVLGKSYVTLLMREFAIPDGRSDTWQP